ncbi:MAG: hypothetical protein HYV97_18850 [Bdellovibrio sp.]|nr:hypothetical protein [Bdellovibrio sp.]
MKILILLFYPALCLSGFSDLSDAELYQYRPPVQSKKLIRAVIHTRPNSGELAQIERDILKQDKETAEILKAQGKTLQVRKKDDKILALTRVHGQILNSILAMNTHPSTFIVRLSHDNELVHGGELRCQGYSFEKRIPAKCDLLIMDEHEYQVDVDIWDIDGAQGIIADYFYDGEEKAFLTSSFASFMQGIVDVAKDRITTPFGEATRNNAKNKVLNGLMSVGENAQKKVAESGEKNLQIGYVNSGKQVLVFFNQTLNLTLEEGR